MKPDVRANIPRLKCILTVLAGVLLASSSFSWASTSNVASDAPLSLRAGSFVAIFAKDQTQSPNVASLVFCIPVVSESGSTDAGVGQNPIHELTSTIIEACQTLARSAASVRTQQTQVADGRGRSSGNGGGWNPEVQMTSPQDVMVGFLQSANRTEMPCEQLRSLVRQYMQALGHSAGSANVASLLPAQREGSHMLRCLSGGI